MCSAAPQPRLGVGGLASATVAIPAFDPDGLLPVGEPFDEVDGKSIFRGHDCEQAEAKNRFVVAFGESLTRPALWQQYENLVSFVEQYFDCFLVLLSGQFVTDVGDPEDLYVVFELPGQAIEALPGLLQWQLNFALNSQERSFAEHPSMDLTIHVGLVRAYPPGSSKFDVGNAERLVERHIASSPRGDSIDGGYLEILRCEGGLTDADAIFESPA